MADFDYTYSQPEQEEIRKIREKYLPREERAMDRLRRLDAQAERPGKIFSLVLGTVGTLVFGTGLCCCLVWGLYFLGTAVGIAGAAMLSMAYPAYRKITKAQRAKYAPEILKLTEELGR